MEKITLERLKIEHKARMEASEEEDYPEPPPLQEVLEGRQGFMDLEFFPLSENGEGWYPSWYYRVDPAHGPVMEKVELR